MVGERDTSALKHRDGQDRRASSTRFDDAYFPLKDLASYSGLGLRTLRGYLHHSVSPLPHYRIGGKILVRRSEFDSWAKQFRRIEAAPLESMVGKMLKDIA